MLILLPPSETKRIGGRQSFHLPHLSRVDRVRDTHLGVRAALETVSRDADAAKKALKLGVKNHAEREYNLELDSSGVMPAIERYTGVLYDALDVRELDESARRWVDEHVLVQSALFGLVDAADLIPAYRLSASSRLPELGRPLARAWAPAHDGALAGSLYVLDLRSKDYAALAPLEALGAITCDAVEVVTRGEGGEVHALNHFNKAAKGDLVRRLAQASPSIHSRADLIGWAGENDVEFTVSPETNLLRLVTTQGAPSANR